MKISLTIEFPDELAQEFMQLVRTFDAKHDPRHQGAVKVTMLNQSDLTIEKMTAVLESLDPPPDFMQVWQKSLADLGHK